MVLGRGASASDCTAPYRRRRPERTLQYRTVQTHFATWLALAREGDGDGDPVPAYVEREFRRTWSAASSPMASPARGVGSAGTTS